MTALPANNVVSLEDYLIENIRAVTELDERIHEIRRHLLRSLYAQRAGSSEDFAGRVKAALEHGPITGDDLTKRLAVIQGA